MRRVDPREWLRRAVFEAGNRVREKGGDPLIEIRIVLVKYHRATVIGQLSDPEARQFVEDLKAL